MNRLMTSGWLLIFVAAAVFGGCTSADDQETKLAKIFSDLNKDWVLYEVKKKGKSVVIKVEVKDNVPFKEAKKALEQIQKSDPKLEGYIEFYNSEVGMVLRKVEIIPEAPPST
ncbi:hypothetical protein MNBD_NITROSPINAE02-1173 [hydrothermal vent metagenome]|uniref:Uncharacterized protein n=1 Tax=hydrothermal vent metagenome TaxID=652676 RepID=A0A3B1D1I1_9ZZZZ